MPPQAPYEIIAAPLAVWVAPVATAFPLIDAAPAAAWVKLGTTHGERQQGDAGLTATHSQAQLVFRGQGTGPLKAFRTEEDLLLSLVLHDLTLEMYKFSLNNNTVTTNAPGVGVAGTREVGMYRGVAVAQHALLVRGPSPYDPSGANWNLQYQVPVVTLEGDPAPQFNKSAVAGLVFTFRAMEDPDAESESERFGKIVAQNAAATE